MSDLPIDEEGNYAKRVRAEDGRTLFVFPLTFGRARLAVGSTFNPYLLDASY